MIQTIQIAPPDDWHLHLRDGDALECVVAATALNFRRAIVMPNLRPPVTTVDQAVAYRGRILAAIEKACATGKYTAEEQAAMRHFEPLMVLYLTGATSPQEIEKAANSGVVKAVKLYPAGQPPIRMRVFLICWGSAALCCAPWRNMVYRCWCTVK